MKTFMCAPVLETAQDRLFRSLSLAATVLFSLGSSFCLAQPANDMFANRIVLTGTNIVATGSNVGATKEPGEPNHAGDAGGHSIWWDWTAPFTGQFTISTSGSSFDTLLGVYTGASVSALTETASNDEVPDGVDSTSRVIFSAVSNQTYQIAVDGYAGDSGNVQLLIKAGPPELTAWGAYNAYNTPWGFTVVEAYVPAALSNVVAVAAGEMHSLALTAEGKVVAWGNYWDQWNWGLLHHTLIPAFVPAGLSNVVAIAGGSHHSLALTVEGLVVAWGGSTSGSWAYTIVPNVLSNVVAIAAGGAQSLALTAEGRVVAWGSRTNVPAGLRNVVAIAPGLALTAEGSVVSLDDHPVPTDLSNVAAIAAGDYHYLALTAEGRVVAWGDNEYGQTNVPIWLDDVVAIAAGGGVSSGHWLALTQQPAATRPSLELTKGLSGLELRGHGAPGISCQLLRSSGLTGPWLPTQPVTFTNSVQLLRAPDTTAPAEFFRLLRK